MKFSRINIEGHKFGKLFVIKFIELYHGRSFYECKCDCGNIVIKNRKYLVNGDTKSCGCLLKETGISRHSIFGRMKYENKDGELALFGVRKLKVNG